MAFQLDIQANKSNKSKEVSSLESILKQEIILFGERFGAKKKQELYHELAVLLRAGITLKEALGLIIESQKKNTDKDLLESILQQVINGKSFSQALIAAKVFSEYEFYSLQIGEETGTTAQVCHELGEFYKRKNEQKRIIIGALTYPAIVMVTAITVVIFMLTYVVPMFQDIFKQNQVELPMLTKVIVRVSDFTRAYALYGLLIIVLIAIVFRLFKDNAKLKRLIDYSLLKIPIFGPFLVKIYLAQFTQAIALLTTAKVPLLNSIQMVKKMIQFAPLQESLTAVEHNILKGHSLSESLQSNSLFDNRIISMVRVAEETNQTEYIFQQLSEQYSQEVVQQSKVLTTVLEPFIILFIGVLVAVLLVAMYLPMFQLSSVIN